MRSILIIFSLLVFFSADAQNIIINEVCSRNTQTIADEEGDYQDWIELYNADTMAIDLANFHLSDDKDLAKLWQFPSINIEPNEYLIVFASGKDRKTTVNHWETALFGDSLWKYKTPSVENCSDYEYVHWSDADFDDSEWLEGYGAFGDEDYGYEQTVTYTDTLFRTIYLRQEFNIIDTSKILAGLIHAYYDDGFTVYINGYELMRINMIHNGIKPHYLKTSFRQHNSKIDDGIPPDQFKIESNLLKNILKSGRNVMAIEVHNFWNTHPKLIKPWLSFASSDTTYQFDTIPDLLSTMTIPIHTNFNISGDGEKIYLNNSLGKQINTFDTPPLITNISAGIFSANSDSIVLYKNPSPGEVNSSEAYSSIINDSTYLVLISGYYSDSVKVEVKDADTGFIIKYTLDGSLPSDTSIVYDSAFYIDSTSVIRLRYFSDTLIAGPISNYTYLINENSSLDFFSIISDPYNLWDEEYGIYAFGPSHTSSPPYFEANFWQNWERPVHIQHFSSTGEQLWQQGAGIKIHGNYTRMIPQKSFGIYAKSKYSNSSFDHALIPGKSFIQNPKRFLLRNAGNDYYFTHMRDLLIQKRMMNENLDIQSGKPTNAYINGEYWGIYHLREKIDRFYLKDNWGTNIEEINLLEQNGLIISGDRNSFEELVNYVKTNGLEDPIHYQFINSKIEISNWVDNLISNLYHFNTDWPHHNTKFWNSPDHKWRQILVDQDVTMAYKNDNVAFKNSLVNIHADTNSYLSIFYKELLKNEHFKHYYINRFSDLMNTIFLKDEYLLLLDSLIAEMDPEMEKHSIRWSRNYSLWEDLYMQNIRNFIGNRAPHMRNHLREFYSLGINDSITLQISEENTGRIKLNSIYIEEQEWTGLYFDSVPVNLEAIPNPGYEFVSWESATSPNLADSGRIINQLYLKSHDIIKANFYSPSGGPDTLQIIFCEINSRSYSNAEAGDWIEIYNKEADSIDLSNWTLKGLKPYKTWSIPEGTKIAPQSRIVLVQDTSLFTLIHPEVNQFFGPFKFGINSQTESISLWDELDRKVTSLLFAGDPPWPIAENTSQSIELSNIELDEQIPENWKLACPGGSPGLAPQNCEIENDLIFTEINYKSDNIYNTGDWIELYNRSLNSIVLSQWIFRDENKSHQFILPDDLILESEEKIIIAEDTSLYFSVHPRDSKVIGSFDFGLSTSGETISLCNQFDMEAVSLEYSSSNPWPEDASGTGLTIELKETNLDMTLGENWTANCFLGTPLKNIAWCVQSNSIVITEIKYQSSPDMETGDWIELYNTNDRELSLMNWSFVSAGDTIIIDPNYLFEPDTYITLSADTMLFNQVYDSIVEKLSVANFDFQKEEGYILILDPYKHPGNILSYHHLLEWPIFQNDTNDRTLELKDYSNALDPRSWRAGCEFGTPSKDPSFCDTEGIVNLASAYYGLFVHPNPSSSYINIEFSLMKRERIGIQIYNSHGESVIQESNNEWPAGKHIINLNLNRLHSGIYYLQISGENGVERQKIIKVQ